MNLFVVRIRRGYDEATYSYIYAAKDYEQALQFSRNMIDEEDGDEFIDLEFAESYVGRDVYELCTF